MAMENRKQLLLIVFAVAAGLIATALTSSYVTTSIQRQTEQLKEDYDAKQREVVAAIQQQNDQKMAALAQELDRVKAEQTELVKKQVAEAQARVQGGAAAAAVKKPKPSLAIKTPPGKRAVTIQLESLNAVGGLLNPGDAVDVIAHLNVPASSSASSDRKNTVTAMLFQQLQVLAVNTNLDETGVYYDQQQSAPHVKVTVAVDPQEAGLLVFADQNGKLELALRSQDETEHQMVAASTWKTLADYVLENQGAEINLPAGLRASGESKEAPKEDKPSIQIFRGGKEL